MKELHEITRTAIPLTRSQQTGYAKFCERLEEIALEHQREQNDMAEFLKICLVENGADPNDTYEFNTQAREWRLKQDA